MCKKSWNFSICFFKLGFWDGPEQKKIYNIWEEKVSFAMFVYFYLILMYSINRIQI